MGSIAAPAQQGLFDSPAPVRLINGSFFYLTLPLVVVSALTSARWVTGIYIWLFGLTHFILTLSIYLQSGNLRYFRATPRNVLLFFVAPLGILMTFYVVSVLQINARYPVFAVIFSFVVRTLDFNHLNRQSYGVYQIFKARTGLRLPAGIRAIEQAYLNCLTALLLTTFLAGGLCPLPFVRGWRIASLWAPAKDTILPLDTLQGVCAGLLLCAAVFGGASLLMLVRGWNEGGRPRGLFDALGYLGIQTLAAMFAVISFPLYFAALATHYVEYHVMMYPRCFRAPLDDRSRLDRWFGALRRNRVAFYGVTLTAAAVVLALQGVGKSPSLPLSYRAVVSIFDGLFVFHYFVEMFIWRFNVPFFRQALTPLYFGPKPQRA